MRPRDKLVLEFWDRSRELNVNSNKYGNFVNNLSSLLLKSDIQNEDLTTNSLIKNKKISARIIAKEDGILAGIEELIFLNKDLKTKQLKNDRDKIKKDEILLEISGDARKILGRERTNLNLLQRMSGIATITNSLSKKLNDIKIAATRKALWGLLDKKAVSLGGGLTHRLNLNDGVIIKDNHLKIMKYDFEKIINLVKNKSKYIEIEVEDRRQAFKAVNAIKKIIEKNNKNVYAIMVDKIPPNEIKSIIKNLKNQNLYDYVLFEASGNISTENLSEYSDCGVDLISMGSITNSATALNMSQEVK